MEGAVRSCVCVLAAHCVAVTHSTATSVEPSRRRPQVDVLVCSRPQAHRYSLPMRGSGGHNAAGLAIDGPRVFCLARAAAPVSLDVSVNPK